MTKIFASILSLLSLNAAAELVSLDDQQLGSVNGAGIGFVLEDFAFEAGTAVESGNRLDISGIKNSSGQDVVLSVSQFYVAGSGSNKGANVIGNPVNLGRLLYPYNIELVDGDTLGISDKAVFEYAAPQRLVGSGSGNKSMLVNQLENRTESRFPGQPVAKGQRVDRVSGIDYSVLSSRASEQADLGIRFDLEVAGARSQSLEAHATGFVTDGSYLRLWGENNEMVGNLAVNAYAKSLTFYACDANGANCGQNVTFGDFVLESELGWGQEQPVTFEVDASGNFTVEVGSIAGHCGSINSTGGCADAAGQAYYRDFYDNGPRTDIHIGNVSVGSADFGSATVSNLQIQYLRATSRDL